MNKKVLGDTRAMLTFAFAWRVFLAIFVCTSFDPDEYWQGPEVAHRLVFGYGHLTWEWAVGLRGILHPVLFTPAYFLVKHLHLDSPFAVQLAPRLTQALLALATDAAFSRFVAAYFSPTLVPAALLLHCSSWFNAFTLARPYSNCLETLLLLLCLNAWPINRPPRHPHYRSERAVAILCAGLSCVLRPASAVIYLPLAAREAFRPLLQRRSGPARPAALPHFAACAADGISIAAATAAAAAVLDFAFYRRPVFPPWAFLRFNVLEGRAAEYGTHPPHWYVSQGLPGMLASLLPLVLHGVWLSAGGAGACAREAGRTQRGSEGAGKGHDGTGEAAPSGTTQRGCAPLWPAALAGWGIVVHSAIAHKEFRFVLPLLPLLLPYAAVSFDSLRGRLVSGQRRAAGAQAARLKSVLAWALVLLQMPMLVFFGRFHQRGTVAVMEHLAAMLPHYTRGPVHVLAMTNCHATPWQAHVHRDEDMTFLDCSPRGMQAAVMANARPRTIGVFYVAEAEAAGMCVVHGAASWQCDAARRGLNEQQVVLADPLHHLCRVFGCGHVASHGIATDEACAAESAAGAGSMPEELRPTCGTGAPSSLQPLPSHILMYESLIARVEPFLRDRFDGGRCFAHTFLDERSVCIFERM